MSFDLLLEVVDEDLFLPILISLKSEKVVVLGEGGADSFFYFGSVFTLESFLFVIIDFLLIDCVLVELELFQVSSLFIL